MRGHSALKTRVNALMTRASIAFAIESLRSWMDCRVKPGNDALNFFYSLLAIRFSKFVLPYSLLQTHYSLFPTPNEGQAERRWRSDACEAPVSARHDRRADASSICANRANPPCVLCAPRADPACDRFAQTGQARPA